MFDFTIDRMTHSGTYQITAHTEKAKTWSMDYLAAGETDSFLVSDGFLTTLLVAMKEDGFTFEEKEPQPVCGYCGSLLNEKRVCPADPFIISIDTTPEEIDNIEFNMLNPEALSQAMEDDLNEGMY
jgi:hypothetical protein